MFSGLACTTNGFDIHVILVMHTRYQIVGLVSRCDRAPSAASSLKAEIPDRTSSACLEIKKHSSKYLTKLPGHQTSSRGGCYASPRVSFRAQANKKLSEPHRPTAKCRAICDHFETIRLTNTPAATASLGGRGTRFELCRSEGHTSYSFVSSHQEFCNRPQDPPPAPLYPRLNLC